MMSWGHPLYGKVFDGKVSVALIFVYEKRSDNVVLVVVL